MARRDLSLDPAGPRRTAATQLALALAHGAAASALLVAAFGAVVDGWRLWPVVAVVAVVAVLAGDAWRISRLEPGLYAPVLLGSGLPLRVLCAATVVTCFVAWEGSVGAAALGGVLSLGVVLLEPALAQAREYRVAFVANLPGVTPAPAPVDLERTATGAHLLALLAGILLARAGADPLWWVAVVLLGAGPDVVMGLNTIARMRAGRTTEAQLADAVAAYAPDFLVYTSWPDDGTHQVTMWLPYLERTGRRYVIVTRHNEPAALLGDRTSAPVLMRHGTRDLDDLLVPSLTTAFYVNASAGNSIFVRHHQLTHVFLGHGDSDKPTSYNPTHAMYDRIFAAGEAAVRRYAAHGIVIPRDKFDVVGRPQVEDVERRDGPVAGPDPVVLYAPTWRGHVEETAFHSLPVGEAVVAALLQRGATVVFRPHPFSHSFADDATTIRRIQAMLRDDCESTGRAHVFGTAAEKELSVFDCVNACDAMVSDVSAVVSDFLFSGKPFAMMAMSAKGPDFVDEFPVATASYVVERDLSNLDAALDAMLGDDPLGPTRVAVRTDYLGGHPAEGYAETFVDRAREIIDAPRPAAEPEEEAEGEGDVVGARLSLGVVRTQLAVAARDVVTVGLAAVAVLLSLTGTPRAYALVLVLLAVATMAVLHRRARPGNLAFDNIAGSFQGARLLFLLALGIGWADWHGWSWTAGVGLALLAAAAAAEDTVRDCWDRVGVEVRNLPGLAVDLPEPVRRGHLGIAGIGAVAVVWLVGVVADAPSVVLTLGVAMLGALGVALAVGVVRVHRCVAAEEHLGGALADHAPAFAVYFGSNVGAVYQLGMWMPYFERIGQPFVVVMRNLTMFRAVESITRAPIVHRPTIRSLEDVVVPSLRAAFYVNNATNNTHFVERRQMVHVWLNHGDSEKPACFNPVHAIYDRIFAAGQAGIDRYARHGIEIPVEKFEVVGRPQVEDVVRRTGPVAAVDAPTVLYAPTWRGPYADTEVYSLPRGEQIVQALLDRGITVIFRSHAFNDRFPDSARAVARIRALLESDRVITCRPHLYGVRAEEQMSLADCFNASDAMVADVSAVVSDYLQSGKPFSIVAVGRSPEQLRAEAPAARAAYVVSADLANLDQALEAMLGADPLADERERTRVYYLGDFPTGSYVEGFLRASRELVETVPR